MGAISANPAAAKQASSPPQRPSADGKLEVPIPLIAASITVAGGLLAAYLIHRWSGSREARTRRAAAAVKFREAFAPELLAAQADTSGRINYMEFLRAAYNERHAQAVIAFEPFIPISKLTAFRDDWNRYSYGQKEDGTAQEPDPEDIAHDDLYFLEYSVEWDLRQPDRPRLNTVARITKLLGYASET